MNVLRRGMAALIPLAALAVLSVAPSGDASTVPGVCRDVDGSVYVLDGHAVGCDVVRPQRLHVVGVGSRAACDDMGGHYTAASRVCWDVDY